MTITEERPRELERVSDNGGVPARRVVVRWAARMVRREWRSQLLVLILLTLAVAAAIAGGAAAYNFVPSSDAARFGTASGRIDFQHPDPAGIDAVLAAGRDWFGTVDVVDRKAITIPGLFQPAELRAQDPDGAYAGSMLGLVSGRYPSAAGELALTGGLAALLDVHLGDSVELDSRTWTVVGTVENPNDFNDEFGLVPSSQLTDPTTVSLFADGTRGRFEDFRPPGQNDMQSSMRAPAQGILAATGVLVASTIVLMLVALIAAAGFIVVARRRLRQLGMLAAMGATERHLRLVMLANGVAIGVVAAIGGAALALVAWVAAVPFLEDGLGHRIPRFGVPWWLIGIGMILAIASATGAAWWPARSVARTPIVSALSGRPDPPRSTSRSAGLAVVLVVVGAVCLGLQGSSHGDWTNAFLVIGGTACLAIGVLLVSPLAIRALARLRSRAPVSARLALGDLARYQARSGTALAAISLGLGIAVVVVVAASGAMYTDGSVGNLSDRQILIRLGLGPGEHDPEAIAAHTAAEVTAFDSAVARMGTSLDAAVTSFDVAVAPDARVPEGVPAVSLGRLVEIGAGHAAYNDLSKIFVASPALLALYGVDADAVDPDADVITTETGVLWFLPRPIVRVADPQHLTATYSSLPGTFVTTAALEARGWTHVRAGWLLQTARPLTSAQIGEARSAAAAAGLTIETRDRQTTLATVRNVATGAGALLALAIMAMTIGLIRSEAAGDVRILSATGATSGNRRTLTATTAGALALLGAVLGTAGAYLGYGAGHIHDLGELNPVPVGHLLIIVVGLPVVAAAAGWLLAGREPAWLARALD